MNRGMWFVLLMTVSSVAYAARGARPVSNPWDAVQRLHPGALVEVLSGSQRWPDSCELSQVDDHALSCTGYDAAGVVRLVYPRDAIRDVWIVEPEQNHHILRWIGVGLEVTVFIALTAGSGVGGALFAVLVITVGEASAAVTQRLPRPTFPHRRLIYRAQIAAVSP